LSIRKPYQESMAQEAIGIVEELSGRRVAAFMSNNHIDPDLAIEIFVLQPAPNGREREETLTRRARPPRIAGVMPWERVSGLGEGHHASAILIPQLQAHGAHTVPQ
jgi:hypothetical protein